MRVRGDGGPERANQGILRCRGCAGDVTCRSADVNVPLTVRVGNAVSARTVPFNRILLHCHQQRQPVHKCRSFHGHHHLHLQRQNPVSKFPPGIRHIKNHQITKCQRSPGCAGDCRAAVGAVSGEDSIKIN